ncbi:MAG: MFS transporter [Chloroflexota bacterium]
MVSVSSEKPKDRDLKLINKLAFGFGDVAGAVYAALYGFFMSAFLLDVAGLRPGAVGLILGSSVIIDAFTDPFIGSLSDRTRSRWGRKRPWLLFGAVPLGIAFFLHWLVPPLEGVLLVGYYFVISNLLRIAFTAVNIPYTALTPEMTRDFDQRTQLNTFRFMFSIVGSIIAVVLHPILVSMGGDELTGHAFSTGVWAVVMIVATISCFAGTFELPSTQPIKTKSYSFIQRLQIVFSNRPYLMVTGIYLLSWLTLQFIQANLLLYTRYWLDAEDQFTIFVALIQIVAAVFLPIWTIASTKIGKKGVYVAGASIWLVALIALYFLQPGQSTFLMILSAISGIGVSVAYLIPWSMVPDTIEYNELETGERQEGVFYGMFVFLQKLGLAGGLALSNFALEGAGYINAEVIDGVQQFVEQPDSVLETLRVIVSIAPAIILALSIPIALLYPITRQRYDEIQAELAQRKGL